MARRARVVIPGILHHITQRGNRKQDIFFSSADRELFLDRLAFYAKRAALTIASYCLMTNHTHLLAVPERKDSLWRALKPLHMWYSQYLNRILNQVGINWQGRFFSAPLDERHSIMAFRYVALNPVRAGIVPRVELYQWSSAKLHLDMATNNIITADARWLAMAHKALISETTFKKVEYDLLCRNTFMNIPCGTEEFIRELELRTGRILRFRKRGRPKG